MGNEDPIIAIFRGLKIRVRVLDRFLNANKVDETYGLAPFYETDRDKQSRLLRSKVGGGDTRSRISIPSKRIHDESNFAYVAWAWEMVYNQKEILLDQQLPMNSATGWAALKDKILTYSHDTDVTWEAAGHGKMGLFIIVSDERPYFPTSFQQLRNCESLIPGSHLHTRSSRFADLLFLVILSRLSLATSARPLLTCSVNDKSTEDWSMELTRGIIHSRTISDVNHYNEIVAEPLYVGLYKVLE